MMDLKQTKIIVASSTFSSEAKNELLNSLSSLGKFAISAFGIEISRKDSNLVEKDLVEKSKRYADIIQGLKSLNPEAKDNFFEELKALRSGFNEEERIFFLYFVIDVRIVALPNRFTESEFEQILDYEGSLFWYLPQQEVLYLLQNQLLYLVPRINLFMDVQVAIYDHDWDYSKGFIKIFSDSLLNNKEILGTTNKKTVASWIKEYINEVPTALTERNAMKMGEFLLKNSLVKSLEDKDKKVLAEILKLFAWFLKPSLDEDEIYRYKSEVAVKKEKWFKELFIRENGPIAPEPNLEPKPTQSVAQPVQVRPAVIPKQNVLPPVFNDDRPKPKEPIEAPAQRQNLPYPPRSTISLRNTPAIDGASSVNIQDLLKRQREKAGSGGGGLKNQPKKMSESTFSAPVKPVAVSLPKPDIDKKLAELKKRENQPL